MAAVRVFGENARALLPTLMVWIEEEELLVVVAVAAEEDEDEESDGDPY